MELLLTLLLVFVGLLLLLLSLAGVAFGVHMAFDGRTREQGIFFAIWWVPAVAASIGVLVQDWVAFTIGVICFGFAGVALLLEHRSSHSRNRSKRTGSTAARKRSPGNNAKHQLLDQIKKYRKTSS